MKTPVSLFSLISLALLSISLVDATFYNGEFFCSQNDFGLPGIYGYPYYSDLRLGCDPEPFLYDAYLAYSIRHCAKYTPQVFYPNPDLYYLVPPVVPGYDGATQQTQSGFFEQQKQQQQQQAGQAGSVGGLPGSGAAGPGIPIHPRPVGGFATGGFPTRPGFNAYPSAPLNA